jgi:hypothetical protein
MLELKECGIIAEDEYDIKVTPISGFFVLQIASAILRGTLIIDRATDREELVDLGNAIADMMEKMGYMELETMIDPNAKPL